MKPPRLVWLRKGKKAIQTVFALHILYSFASSFVPCHARFQGFINSNKHLRTFVIYMPILRFFEIFILRSLLSLSLFLLLQQLEFEKINNKKKSAYSRTHNSLLVPSGRDPETARGGKSTTKRERMKGREEKKNFENHP